MTCKITIDVLMVRGSESGSLGVEPYLRRFVSWQRGAYHPPRNVGSQGWLV